MCSSVHPSRQEGEVQHPSLSRDPHAQDADPGDHEGELFLLHAEGDIRTAGVRHEYDAWACEGGPR